MVNASTNFTDRNYVTQDDDFANKTDRVIHMADGEIISQ